MYRSHRSACVAKAVATAIVLLVWHCALAAEPASPAQSTSVPSKTQPNEAGTTKPEQKAEAKKEPAANTPPPVNPVVTGSQNVHGGGFQPESDKKRDDPWDAKVTDILMALFNFGLVVVGYIQVRVIRRQARIMEAQARIADETLVEIRNDIRASSKAEARQAKDMKRSIAAAQSAAEAAELNAKAVIGVEIPRFVVLPIDDKWLWQDPVETLRRNFPYISLCNHGRTSAVLVEHSLGSGLLSELGDVPHYFSRYSHRIGEIIEPNQTDGMRQNIKTDYILDEERAEAVCNGRETYCVYGRIVYKDFMEIEREFGFIFSIFFTKTGGRNFFEPHSRPGGHPKYSFVRELRRDQENRDEQSAHDRGA